MIGGRDGIGKGGVVGQRYMEAGDPRPLQHGQKDGQLRHKNTGVAVVGVLHPDGQLVVDGQVGKAAADGGYCLHGKAGTMGRASPVAVRPVIEKGRAEAAAHPVPMDLDHIKADGFGLDGGFTKGICDLCHLSGRQLGDVGTHRLVEPFSEIIGAQTPGEYAGHTFQNGHEVGVRLVELGADLASVAMGGVDESPVVGLSLF